MKKFFLLISALFIFGAPVFADHSLRAGLVFSYFTGNDEREPYDPVDISTSGYGFCFEYVYEGNNGLVFKAGDCISSISFTYKSLVDVDTGTEGELYLGLGYEFVKNENMSLFLTGNAGVKGQLLYGSGTDYLDRTAVMFTFGPEFSFNRRFNEHLGFFINAGVMYNIGRSNNSGAPSWIENDVYGFSFPVKAGLSYTF
ncbi:MAG: hypothetical protein J5780_01025 [Treponema sp.]|nr:hypothetical protein [Treponema sp.]